MIEPETKPENTKVVAAHLRMLNDAEPSRAIASPLVAHFRVSPWNTSGRRPKGQARSSQTIRRNAEVS